MVPIERTVVAPRPGALRSAIDRACAANNPLEARAALGAWLGARWKMSQPAALTLVTNDPVIAALNAALFGAPQSAQQPWQGATLREWTQHVPTRAPAGSVRRRPTALPPLYP